MCGKVDHVINLRKAQTDIYINKVITGLHKCPPIKVGEIELQPFYRIKFLFNYICEEGQMEKVMIKVFKLRHIR